MSEKCPKCGSELIEVEEKNEWTTKLVCPIHGVIEVKDWVNDRL
jgi:uncharacterized Zn finger protein (UPF0148 family)